MERMNTRNLFEFLAVKMKAGKGAKSSTCQGYRSAWKCMFMEAEGVSLHDENKQKSHMFFTGLKKKEARAKAADIIPLHDGKAPMGFNTLRSWAKRCKARNVAC